jgi:hypothetical protein
VTLSRRVATLETALSPTELVLRWLDEAHACGDLESYARSLLAGRVLEGPLDRLAREAAQGARASIRGKPPEVVASTVRGALRETVFRFELVMRITVTAYDLLERETLIDAALAAQLALLASEDRDERRRDPAYRERLMTCRALLRRRVEGLRAAADARAIVEARFLDGHAALFPEALAAWDAQLASTAALADLADRLAEFEGVEPADSPDAGTRSARAAELVADLVEPAKASALEKLGEGERALGIATGWLRTRLLVDERAVDPDPAAEGVGP